MITARQYNNCNPSPDSEIFLEFKGGTVEEVLKKIKKDLHILGSYPNPYLFKDGDKRALETYPVYVIEGDQFKAYSYSYNTKTTFIEERPYRVETIIENWVIELKGVVQNGKFQVKKSRKRIARIREARSNDFRALVFDQNWAKKPQIQHNLSQHDPKPTLLFDRKMAVVEQVYTSAIKRAKETYDTKYAEDYMEFTDGEIELLKLSGWEVEIYINDNGNIQKITRLKITYTTKTSAFVLHSCHFYQAIKLWKEQNREPRKESIKLPPSVDRSDFMAHNLEQAKIHKVKPLTTLFTKALAEAKKWEEA